MVQAGQAVASPPVMRRIVRGAGKTLISLGVLILLFVVYQLWGTGLTHDREQRNLRSQFAKDDGGGGVPVPE